MRERNLIRVVVLLASVLALCVLATQTAMAAEQKVQFKVPGVV